MIYNPTNRTIDLTIFARTQIEYVHLFVRSFYRMEYSIDAVTNIKIRFSLMTVAQNRQRRWIRQQFFIEVKNVAVSVSFSKNRNKSKDPRFHSEAFAIRSDQSLAGKFGCTV